MKICAIALQRGSHCFHCCVRLSTRLSGPVPSPRHIRPVRRRRGARVPGHHQSNSGRRRQLHRVRVASRQAHRSPVQGFSGGLCLQAARNRPSLTSCPTCSTRSCYWATNLWSSATSTCQGTSPASSTLTPSMCLPSTVCASMSLVRHTSAATRWT